MEINISSWRNWLLMRKVTFSFSLAIFMDIRPQGLIRSLEQRHDGTIGPAFRTHVKKVGKGLVHDLDANVFNCPHAITFHGEDKKWRRHGIAVDAKGQFLRAVLMVYGASCPIFS